MLLFTNYENRGFRLLSSTISGYYMMGRSRLLWSRHNCEWLGDHRGKGFPGFGRCSQSAMS